MVPLMGNSVAITTSVMTPGLSPCPKLYWDDHPPVSLAMLAVKFDVASRCPERLKSIHCITGTAVTGGVADSLRLGVISSEV